MSHSILLGGFFGLAFRSFLRQTRHHSGSGPDLGPGRRVASLVCDTRRNGSFAPPFRFFHGHAERRPGAISPACSLPGLPGHAGRCGPWNPLLIGSIFGILFQRDVRGYDSSMGWGLGFGIFVWFFGPLTIFPIVGCQPLEWSAEQGAALFGSPVRYIIYGFILGTIYAFLDRIWVRLFIQSDPLNREPEGLGLHFLRSIGWGGLAGLVGGLVSLPVLAATGILPKIAGLDTSFGGISGLVIHLLVSVVIGMTYGLLFRNEAPSIGLGVPWGFLFGLIWWYVGR